MRFDGSSGRKPSAEARRYVYAILESVIDNDLADDGGWIYGGLVEEVDRRRVKRAAQLVAKELHRKAKS